MATKNQTKNGNHATKQKRNFFPISVLRNGILSIDGHMTYTDTKGSWLYVSEDGQTVIMYNNLADLINEMLRRSDGDDYVVTGWDLNPTRFNDFFDEAYHYYNAHFD